MLPYVERYARDGSIAILGSNVWPGFPLVNYGRVAWSSRFPTLWLLPGTAQKRSRIVCSASSLSTWVSRISSWL